MCPNRPVRVQLQPATERGDRVAVVPIEFAVALVVDGLQYDVGAVIEGCHGSFRTVDAGRSADHSELIRRRIDGY